MDSLPDEMKIACCKTCLLAERMKDCKACTFKIGLVYRTLDRIKALQVEYPVELKQARISHLALMIV